MIVALAPCENLRSDCLSLTSLLSFQKVKLTAVCANADEAVGNVIVGIEEIGEGARATMSAFSGFKWVA